MLVTLSQLSEQQLNTAPEEIIKPVLSAGYEPQSYGAHLTPRLAGGATTTDTVWRLEIERKQIYIESNLIATGTKIASTDTMKQLKQKFAWPSDVTVEYPVAFSYIGRRQGIEWSEYEMILQKSVIHMEYQDEAKIGGAAAVNKKFARRRIAESMATTVDTNILSTLSGGEYAVGKDVDTEDKWDVSGANPPDIYGDIAKCMETLQSQTQRPEGKLERDLFLLLPLNAKPWLRIPDMVNQQRTTIEKLIMSIWGLTIHFTRNTSYSNDCTMGYRGEETITHGVLSTNAFPLIEEERDIGRGDHQVIRKYFGTAIRPYEMGQTTSKNLVSLTDVFAD